MALSIRESFEDPKKSPYNYERYDSKLEGKMMIRLEADPTVRKWTKKHGITIPWIDGQKRMRRYHPDFLVEYVDGRKALIEVKDPTRVDSNEVLRKRKAAEMWCKQRGMEYLIATIDPNE